jgi:hypothetical protein
LSHFIKFIGDFGELIILSQLHRKKFSTGAAFLEMPEEGIKRSRNPGTKKQTKISGHDEQA